MVEPTRHTPRRALGGRRPSGHGRTPRLAALTVLGPALWLVFAAPPAVRSGELAYPSVERTRKELRAVCERLRDSDNPYFGRRAVERIEARLQRVDEDEVETRARLRGYLGSHLLRLGRLEEAVEHLEAVRDLLDREAERLTPEVEADLRRTVLSTLATAHLLLAEDRNCLDRHVPQSCILPLAPEAVHRKPEPARAAGDLSRGVLELAPDHLPARWLLNLSRMLADDALESVPEDLRLPPDTLSSPEPFPRWPNVASSLGVDVVDLSGGAVMDDFDGDGLLDLVTTTWDPCGPMKAFRNDGRGGFENVTEEWGLDGQLGGLNLTHADFDGDGMLDLYVLRGAWMGSDGRIRNSLLRNDLEREAGRFVDVTVSAGLAYPAYPSHSAGWNDFDGDGDLDLYVGNESPAQTTVPQTLYGRTERPYSSQLFRNDGDGTFTPITRRAGVANDRFAKGVAWGDYDDDGDSDLYVSNIGPNRLYRNEGDGTFTDVAPALGVDEPAAQSFGTWFFDHDNDGDLDLWVNRYGAPVDAVFASYLGMSVSGGAPVLYRNDGGRFTDVSDEVGLHRPLLPMGANYGDLDNDGFPDVYLGTGVPDPDALMPNVMYRNDGGRRFVDVTFAGGFGHLQKGHGIAFGDLDNDGDQDLFEQMGGAYPYDEYGNVLYENPGPARTWITLRLRGRRANRFGVGARIEVVARTGEETRSIHALAGAGGSFGASSLQQEIGLGDADAVERVVIRWPGSGTVQTFEEVEPNRYYLAVEGEDRLRPVELPRLRLGDSGRHEGHPPASADESP